MPFQFGATVRKMLDLLKEIVHLWKNVVIDFDIIFSLCYQKQTLALIILLHSFVIISFIKTINCTT